VAYECDGRTDRRPANGSALKLANLQLQWCHVTNSNKICAKQLLEYTKEALAYQKSCRLTYDGTGKKEQRYIIKCDCSKHKHGVD